MSAHLEVLTENSSALLLAEAMGWLHDMGKCTDDMIVRLASDRPQGFRYKPEAKQAELVRNEFPAILKELSLLGESVSLEELATTGMHPGSVVRTVDLPWIQRALAHCHGAAHFSKEHGSDSGAGKQRAGDTRLSTPFGHEGLHVQGLTQRLDTLPFGKVADREHFQSAVKGVFGNAPGDTRRPTNDVTLWSWSSVVAALYKAALAGALLGHQPPPEKLRWRLLAVRFSGGDTLRQAVSIPALLARRQWLEAGLDRVQVLLESTYPLGTEIYRDENGSIYVVPDIADLDRCLDCKGQPLSDAIQEALGYEGELIATVEIDESSWSGSPTKDRRTHEIPPINVHVQSVPSSPADPHVLADWWDSPSARGSEICTVSGLRPQGPSLEGRRRRVSDMWLERSKGRAKEWLQQRGGTIWIDEVADVNGRLCLVVGQFGIDGWLQPDGYIRSLLSDAPGVTGETDSKNPSFARLQSVWQATRLFWEEIAAGFRETLGSIPNAAQFDVEDTEPFIEGDNAEEGAPARLLIRGTFIRTPDTRKLGSPFSYAITFGETSLAVVYLGELDGSDTFITTDNLCRLVRVLHGSMQAQRDTAAAADYLRQVIREGAQRFQIEEPTGYGSPNKMRGELVVSAIDYESTAYVPAISILTEPRSFMALVPADRAIDVATAIKQKYECEMGKVRNRLPLTVGLVFGGHRLPLPVLLDSGRRMLRQPTQLEQWAVSQLHDAEGTSITSACRVLVLQRGSQLISMKVPIKMGDAKTDDDWYTYWCLNESPATSRRRQFEGPGGKTWVHVGDLQVGDAVLLTPSQFDFEFLDTATQRFDIAYDGERRRGSRSDSRPYYLEQLDDLQSVAAELRTGLDRAQIKQLVGLLGLKRSEWTDAPATFEQMARDALAQAAWKEGKRPSSQRMDDLCRAAVEGQLLDAVELCMDIPKPDRHDGIGAEQ